MKIAIIGHTGMSGQALTDILLSRKHEVLGLSHDISNAATRPGLTNHSLDIFDVESVTANIIDADVVVSMFSGGHTVDPAVYYRQVEGTRRLIKAFKAVQQDRVKPSYLIYLGGAASLYVKPGVQMFDDPRFPTWYYGIMPPVHLRWLADITGESFFDDAALRKENGTIAQGESDPDLEDHVKTWTKVPLLEGCRLALDLFSHRTDFEWSFLSPPWFYRPGEGTGKYDIGVDFMINKNHLPSGIAVPDLALAVADEIEAKVLVHRHWTLAGDQHDY
ncbi:NAD(P)-dependent oxidoreductase [Halotalea alkalilenta]|uniref:NAD(P)-dependent oxidoreductase n=1 Tax=Halotalea alkalilenta TaxID=376489 RepID=UPI00047F8FC3|nr:NAD(P)H-binding protein [Halotalea alkalilenta]